MKVSVELPPTVKLDGVDDAYLEKVLIATLYHVGRISAKEGRDALGLTRRAFEAMLPEFGFSVMPDDPLTIQDELNA